MLLADTALAVFTLWPVLSLTFLSRSGQVVMLLLGEPTLKESSFAREIDGRGRGINIPDSETKKLVVLAVTEIRIKC